MRAAWMWARADIARRWASLALLAVLVAFALGSCWLLLPGRVPGGHSLRALLPGGRPAGRARQRRERAHGRAGGGVRVRSPDRTLPSVLMVVIAPGTARAGRGRVHARRYGAAVHDRRLRPARTGRRALSQRVVEHRDRGERGGGIDVRLPARSAGRERDPLLRRLPCRASGQRHHRGHRAAGHRSDCRSPGLRCRHRQFGLPRWPVARLLQAGQLPRGARAPPRGHRGRRRRPLGPGDRR